VDAEGGVYEGELQLQIEDADLEVWRSGSGGGNLSGLLNNGCVLGKTDQTIEVTVSPGFVEDPDPTPSVACVGDLGNGSATRGATVKCTANDFPAAESLDWLFTEDADVNSTVAEKRASAEWTGPVVTSGTVTVRANGGTISASARLVVTARTWPKFRIRADNRGHGGETIEPFVQGDQPKAIHELGHAHLPELPSTLDAAQIPDGPNKGFWYLRSFPTELPGIIHMSRAWKAGHPFREMQHDGPVLDAQGNAVLDVNGTPVRYCKKYELSGMENLTLQHERSHVAQMDAFFRENSPIQDLESAVRTIAQLNGDSFEGYVEDQFLQKPSAAQAQGDRRWEHVPVGKVTLAPFTCQLRLYR
jgi:hypothetical protein